MFIINIYMSRAVFAYRDYPPNSKSVYNIADKSLSIQFRGLCAIFVYLNHFFNYMVVNGQKTIITTVGQIMFGRAGAFAVTMFFFYSGYGIMFNLIKKGSDYMGMNFIKKKIANVYIPFIMANCIWLLTPGCKINNLDMLTALQYITGVRKLNGVMWYLYFLFEFYIAVFILWHISLKLKNNKKIICYGLVLLTIFNIIFLALGHKSSVLWARLPGFAIGVLMAYHQNEFEEVLKHNIVVRFLVSSVLLAILVYIDHFVLQMNSIAEANAIFENIIALAVLIYFSSILKFGNKWSELLGKISYEIYLTHMIVLNFFFKFKGISILTGFATAITVILMSILLHILNDYIKNRLNTVISYKKIS